MSVLAGFTKPINDDQKTGHDSDATKFPSGLSQAFAHSLVQCAVLAYKPEKEVRNAIEEDPACKHFEWFEAVGRTLDTQAFACAVEGNLIVAFRGTKEMRDFLTDALLVKKEMRDFHGGLRESGRVHWGFRRALDGIWSSERTARKKALSSKGPPMDRFLEEMDEEFPENRLWLTGHSLGAALATIAAARVQLTDGAPFQGRIGGLVTIGSPRVFDGDGASALRQALESSAHTFRIYRSIDPVPAVPYFGFKHVSGKERAFVSHAGHLVVGASWSSKWMDTIASALRWLEDSVGSVLPGQHGGFSSFASDHDSEDYLAAVENYDPNKKMTVKDRTLPLLAPALKLAAGGGVGWLAADSSGLLDMVPKVFSAMVSVLQTTADLALAAVL